MPKFGAHILIAEKAASTAENGSKISQFRNSNPYRLGSIGPDLTLFLFDIATKQPEIEEGYKAAMIVMETMDSIEKRVADIADKFKTDIGKWMTGGLSNELIETAELGLSAMTMALKLGLAVTGGSIRFDNPIFSLLNANNMLDLVKDPGNKLKDIVVTTLDTHGAPFRYFGHPYTDDPGWKNPEPPGNYENWWWMDMLHYRKTGDFANKLIALAESSGDSAQLAYAYGYLTHVAGDICGHPCINAIVGAPFRNMAYRHMVVEGLVDTWLWNDVKGKDITSAKLDELINVNKGELDVICELIVTAMRETYTGTMLPGLFEHNYPSTNLLKTAYEKLCRYLRSSTNGRIQRPEPPEDDPGQIWEDIQEQLRANNPGSPPNFNFNKPIDSIIAILGWICQGFEYLVMLITLPVALAASVLTYPTRWVLYILQESIYLIISGLRSLLALTGWGYASSDDFDNFSFLSDMIKPNNEFQYPAKYNLAIKPHFYWLARPSHLHCIDEKPNTLVAPHNRKRVGSMLDMANVMTVSPEVEAMLNPTSQTDLHILYKTIQATAGHNGFGNAVDFYYAMLSGNLPIPQRNDTKMTIPNLDLDGDRGYGYGTWEIFNGKFL